MPTRIIDVAFTPNPRVRKYQTDGRLTDIPLEFVTAPSHTDMIEKLFDLFEVERVFVVDDYIAITIGDEDDWAEVDPVIRAVLASYIKSFDPAIYSNTVKITEEKTSSPLEEKIRSVLDQYVRPAVANDGGDIQFMSYEQETGTLYVSMHGACSGCPSSTATLKLGVENLMQHMVPEVLKIESI